jgi:glycerophosphoryl diester phosphodiesterase
MRVHRWLPIVVLVVACGDDGAPGTTDASSSTAGSGATMLTSSDEAGDTSGALASSGDDTGGADTSITGDTGEAPEDVLDADRVLNIAHAGGKGTRPEHTMIAYETALAEGTDVLELDVHATSDGVLVLMHDETVDRTTDGSGAIASMTFAELRELDAGYTFTEDDGATHPFRGMGLQVPSVEEVFEAFPEVAYVIEIKQAEPSIVEPLLAMCDAHGISDQMVASAFSQDVLLELRAAAPQMPTSFAVAEVIAFMALSRETEATYEPPARFLQVPLEQAGLPVLTPELVERAGRFDLKVHAWTINDEAEMEMLIDLGVDGIITDYPARLQMLLDP